MISGIISILMRMHCCTVHTPCYAIKHLTESLSYIDIIITPFDDTQHTYTDIKCVQAIILFL